MRSELVVLHQRLKSTMVYVAHDQVEAMTMADRIVVLCDGVVEQVGKPIRTTPDRATRDCPCGSKWALGSWAVGNVDYLRLRAESLIGGRQLSEFASKVADMSLDLGVDHCTIVEKQPHDDFELHGQVANRSDGKAEGTPSESIQLIARPGPPRPGGVVAYLSADGVVDRAFLPVAAV